MRGRSFFGRPPREWVARALLATGMAVLGYVGAVQSIASRLRSSDPQQAHAIAPWDGRATAALARRMSTGDIRPSEREQADDLARLALRQDPTAVGAASILAINQQILGKGQRTQRLIGYAQSLSRRDLGTQIWMIEDAVNRSDISGALRHYDIALRTSPKASALLFPILSTAIQQPEVRSPLARVLTSGASWSPLFVEYAAANAPDPTAAAALFSEMARLGRPVAALPRVVLTDTLVSRGLFEQAWEFYAAQHRGADRRTLRDSSFSANPADATIFDWRVGSDARVGASIQPGLVDFTVPAGVGGTIVTQMEMLRPGQYRLVGHGADIDQPTQSAPYWRLSCRDGREPGRVTISNSSDAGGVFAGTFVVPADCPVQTLDLVAVASDEPAGLSGQIDRVRLMPVDQAERMP